MHGGQYFRLIIKLIRRKKLIRHFAHVFNPHQFNFMKKLLLLASAIITFSFANAQYDMAIGAIYAKDGIGLSYKQFLQPEQNIVINAMYSQNNDDFGGLLVGLYEFHKEIHASTLHTTQLSWSFGGGLHTGYWVTKGNYVPTAFKFGFFKIHISLLNSLNVFHNHFLIMVRLIFLIGLGRLRLLFCRLRLHQCQLCFVADSCLILSRPKVGLLHF